MLCVFAVFPFQATSEKGYSPKQHHKHNMASSTSDRSELQRVIAFVESRIPEITGFSSDGTQFGSLRQVWATQLRSEEHTSELQSLMRISYAVFCLKKQK